MGEGNYTIVILGEKVKVEVTEYIPEIKGEYSKIPEQCYPNELEDIQYIADESNELLNFFLNNYIFEQFDSNICKQLSKKINKE